VNRDLWSEIDNLPDNRAKIASSANRIGDTIFIIGGYYVSANGTEISSKKVHRYDLKNDKFLEDGKDIPFAIDDQVQVVYRDSLIYVITGWSNTTNLTNVQVYDPLNDIWSQAIALPNISLYKVFGGAGTIIKDTIFYFGGARIGGSFPANYGLIKGVINPNNPLDIQWTDISPDLQTLGYRTACTNVNEDVHWIGGSETSYNYNGIAYNGSGPVDPSGNILISNPENRSVWFKDVNDEIPMDLRGVASLSDTSKIIVGGMLAGPNVSNKALLLEWKYDSSLKVDDAIKKEAEVRLFPNPTNDIINVEMKREHINMHYSIYNFEKELVKSTKLDSSKIDVQDLTPGSYILLLTDNKWMQYLRFEKI
jgi:hypothetical protein